MAYIGREPQIGNYQICDAISVVNGQAAYTMQVSSVNVIPESVNHMIVSLNGVIQKPGSSYTISSSTITFSSNLATGDSIDFIYLLGNVLDLGVPSDSTVTSGKLSGNLVTPGTLDVNGQELILDADADTSITADTDDQIDFKAGGTDIMSLTATTAAFNDGVTISVNDNTDTLKLISTDADASIGPVLVLHRDSGSPADNDVIGELQFAADSDAASETNFALVKGTALDVSHGSESGQLDIQTRLAGTGKSRIKMNATETVVNEDSANLDFRVESDGNSNMLNVDAGTNRVGIGKSNPQNKIDIDAETWDDGILIKNTGNFNTGIIADANRTSAGGGLLNLQGRWNGTEVAGMIFQAGTDTTNKDDGEIVFRVASAGTPAEKLRIATTGRIHTNATTNRTGHLNLIGERGSSYKAVVFEHTGDGGQVGTITTGSSSVAYNTSSDYRLKENIVAMEDATTRLKQLQPKRFNFKSDADKTVDGFLAHEVSSIVPEAISGEKDETETKEKVVVNSKGNIIHENIEKTDWEKGIIVDDNGDSVYPTDSTWEATKVLPVYQGIDQAKLVPLLVKTIQELEARIKTLEDA